MNLPAPTPPPPPPLPTDAAAPAGAKARLAWITPEPLNVAPHLVGMPLAPPARRAWAMGVDLVVVALLSGVSGFWLLGGLALVLLQLRSQKGSTTRKRQVVGWLGAGLLVLLALQSAKSDWEERDGGPAAAEAADAADAAAEAAAGVAVSTPNLPGFAVAASATAAASAASAAAPASAAAAAAEAAAASAEVRLAQLQAELDAARKPRTWRQQVDAVLESVGARFGWGIVYFALLPAWWGGQTVGKKLFGLQVVELTGKPMTVLRCLKRYGGYAAGMATGGLGFAQALWDPNRQALQDKAAHTAVVDLRGARAEVEQGMDVRATDA
jgi:uncharacterized RDD family membrane protein YckC